MFVRAEDLSVIGLSWLRFSKRCDYVATEVGYWNADIVGVNETECIEIETKVSKHDAENEIKKIKHKLYHGETIWRPNRFYFLVTEQMLEETVRVSDELNPKYGIMVLKATPNRYSTANGHARVVRIAKSIHSTGPTERIKRDMAARMSSQIVNSAISNLGRRESYFIGELMPKIVDMESRGCRGPNDEILDESGQIIYPGATPGFKSHI